MADQAQDNTLPELPCEIITMILSELEAMLVSMRGRYHRWLNPSFPDCRSLLAFIKNLSTLSRSWHAASVPFIFAHGAVTVHSVDRAEDFNNLPLYIHENVTMIVLTGDFSAGFRLPNLPRLKAVIIHVPRLTAWNLLPPDRQVSGVVTLRIYKSEEASEEEVAALLARMRNWLDMKDLKNYVNIHSIYMRTLRRRFGDKNPITLVLNRLHKR